MKKYILAITAVLAIVAGCAKVKVNDNVRTHSGIKEITATIDDQTRTYLGTQGDVYKMFWYEGEAIKIGSGNVFADFTLTEGENTPKGKFASDEDLPTADFWFAVTPADALESTSGDSLYISYTPDLSYDSELGSAVGNEVLVAKSSDTTFLFRNVIGYIKFQLNVSQEEQIEKIEISGKDGASVAGKARVVFKGSEVDTVRFIEDQAITLNVDFPDPQTVTPDETFTILIPVAPLAKGVSITTTMASGKSMTVTTSTGVNIGQILELPAIDFVPVVVAKVGEVHCYSIRQAIDVADDLGEDATITLTADCNTGANCEISSTSAITLDLNGHTLTAVGENNLVIGSNTQLAIITDNSAEKDGVIRNINENSTPVKVYGPTIFNAGKVIGGKQYGIYVRGGSLVMDGGRIESNSSGICVKPDEGKTIDSIIVKGDSYISTTSGSGVWMHSKNTNLTFYGGDIFGKVVAAYVYDGILKIYDGTFGAKSNVIFADRAYDNQVDIYGGKFHRDSINAIVSGHATTDSCRVWAGFYNSMVSSTYIPAGYTIASCDTTIDGRQYTVTISKTAEIQATVSINGGEPVDKATINDAILAATSTDKDAVITLVADCSPTDSMSFNSSNKITLDFNGKTITCNSNRAFKVDGDNTDVTFKSSVAGGGINQTSSGTGCIPIRQRGGKVTIESGIFGGAGNQWTFYTTGGEFHCNGGEFYADSNVIWVSHAKLYVNGGKFIKRETSKKETEKQIYITTDGEAIFNGGEFESVYVYNSNTKATFVGGNYPSFTLGGGCHEIKIEDGTYQNIHFNPGGTITVTGGSFNGRSYMEGSGTLNIEGGTFTNQSGTYQYAMWPTAGKVNIKNATFNGGTSYGTLRFTKCVVTIDEGTVVNSSHESGNAIYVGIEDYSANVTINGGTFNSPKAIYGANGALTINDGIFNCTEARLLYSANNIKTQVFGGYFNTTATTATIEGGTMAGIFKGGWFNKAIPLAAIDPAFMLDNSQSTVVEGITYNFHVIENTAAPDVATVNGTGYKTLASAITAANEYSGEDSVVTLKLVSQSDTLALNSTTEFTNTSGKHIVLDLNNRTILGGVDSLITTNGGTLTITDSSAEKGGVIAAAKRRMITMSNGGTINLKGITIDCSRSAYGNLNPEYSAIALYGSSTLRPTLNISDGTVIKSKNYWWKAIYVKYGNLNTENCEIITNYKLKMSGSTVTEGTNKGYPTIFGTAGCNINIKAGSFIQARGEENNYGALYVRSNEADATFVVEDGAYLWSNGANGSLASSKSTSGAYYSQWVLYLNGGYFLSSPAKYLPIIPSGKSLVNITPVTYTSSIGETVSFDYQVK